MATFFNHRSSDAFLAMAAWALILSFAAAGCGRDEDGGADPGGGGGGSSPGVRTVVTTTGMITDVVREIIGDDATARYRVVGLIGGGVDPHLYRATRSDMTTLLGADIVFYNGLLLEGKMTDALERVAQSGKPVHAVTAAFDASVLIGPEGDRGGGGGGGEHADPHVWMDPALWSDAASEIAQRLSEFDPDSSSVFMDNLAAYGERIDELSAYAEGALSSVPERSRVLVTAHDAFRYFGRRFGVEVVGIQGISTESEASVRDIERIVDLLVEREVRAVFVESTVSQRNVQALIDGARAAGWSVTIGGELFSDAMGLAGTYEGTYIGMIDHNVTTVARALGGNAPEGGMSGHLAGGGKQ